MDEIVRIYGAAEKSFPKFMRFTPDDFVFGVFEPEKLPPVGSFDGFTILDITTHGRILKGNRPLEKFKTILDKGEQAIGGKGLLSVYWHFREKQSCGKRGDASVMLELRSGRRFIGCRLGSNASLDYDYAKRVISSIKDAADLPIVIVESGSDFSLEHSLGGEIRTLVSAGFGINPTAFLCEMNGSTVDDLLAIANRVHAEFGTDKYESFSWGACNGSFRDPAVSREIYAHVYENAFPADRLRVDVEFSLEDFRVIQCLPSLCGPKDKVWTEICTFHLSEDNYANVKVVTSREGHRIFFELRMPEDLKALREKLQVKIHKDYAAG